MKALLSSLGPVRTRDELDAITVADLPVDAEGNVNPETARAPVQLLPKPQPASGGFSDDRHRSVGKVSSRSERI